MFQGTYDDNLNKVLASLGSGDLPALAQLDDPKTQLMADSGAVVPVQDFIDAEVREAVTSAIEEMLLTDKDPAAALADAAAVANEAIESYNSRVQ